MSQMQVPRRRNEENSQTIPGGGQELFPVSSIQPFEAVQTSHSYSWGLSKPPRFRSQGADSILYLVDSAYRQSGTPFDFMVQCGKSLSALTVEITKAQIPKLPNVNRFNNTFTIVSETGTYSVTLTPGFYNPTSLVNELKQKIDTAMGVDDSVTVLYNTANKTISIASNGGNKWFFVDVSPFILRGNSLTGFNGLSAALDPAVVGAITQYSDILGMIYSRYVRVRSSVLTQFAMETCRSSAGINNILACISLANFYNPTDYDQSGAFGGAIITDTTAESSAVTNVAARVQINFIDIRIEDEYGTTLQDVLWLGDPYPQPTFGALLWLRFVV